MKPIYEPKGRAKEYGDYAINIYTGCPHRCFYCFAPNVLRRDREAFHQNVEPRKNIVEEVRKQIEHEHITDKLVHLCFTCDPYPTGYDSTPTREIIKILKESGNHIQILTKGDGSRDFDLLDENDWYGITFSGTNHKNEPNAVCPTVRFFNLCEAKDRGIKTWVSFEPVLNCNDVINLVKYNYRYIDLVKIGKLNYYKSDTNWADFGKRAEALCKGLGLNYYIKESLRKEMGSK